MENAGPRHQALSEVGRFKASWVDLGAVLSQIAGQELWLAWGFASFEKYCRAELHLRAETASKLVRSYTFLHGRRGEACTQGAPPLDVVDLLSQAESRTQLPEGAYQAVEEEVLGGAQLSRGQVLRRLRHHDPQAFRAAPRATGEPTDPAGAPPEPGQDEAQARQAPGSAHIDPQALRKTLALAARLAELLKDLGLGEQPTKHVQAVVRALRGMVSDEGQAGAA